MALNVTGCSDALDPQLGHRDLREHAPAAGQGRARVKGVLGNEQTKTVPGNWDADHSTPAGQPLTRGPAGTGTTNRKVFLHAFTRSGTHYSDYCKYCFPDSYLPPLSTILDPAGAVQCDEYPFASTR